MESECERLGRHVCGHERLYTPAEVAEAIRLWESGPTFEARWAYLAESGYKDVAVELTRPAAELRGKERGA